MGSEFGQWNEWSEEREVDWSLLNFSTHTGIKKLLGDLNCVLRSNPAMYANDNNWQGFQWVDFSDYASSVVSFVRRHDGAKPIVWVFNFTPVPREGYRLWCPHGEYKMWREILNTDSEYYGGSNMGNYGEVWLDYAGDGQVFFTLTLPPLSAVALMPQE
jgi:1,4-alpha-glucan branching enzyme